LLFLEYFPQVNVPQVLISKIYVKVWWLYFSLYLYIIL